MCYNGFRTGGYYLRLSTLVPSKGPLSLGMHKWIIVTSSTFPSTLGLLLVEPVGSVRPKFPTMDNSRGFVSNEGDALTLLCPAQGFPVPSHRWDKVISRYNLDFRNKSRKRESTNRKWRATIQFRKPRSLCRRNSTSSFLAVTRFFFQLCRLITSIGNFSGSSSQKDVTPCLSNQSCSNGFRAS